MKCPVCKTRDLLMTERQGIEIDYCPTCRGVWLDRGELDKLLNQMQNDAEPAYRGDQPEHEARRDQSWGRQHDSYDDDRRKHYDPRRDPRRKKKSLFDMFDFD
jgi:Zn-finger nucleic acid-binding protein